jgi:hypothetical protein
VLVLWLCAVRYHSHFSCPKILDIPRNLTDTAKADRHSHYDKFTVYYFFIPSQISWPNAVANITPITLTAAASWCTQCRNKATTTRNDNTDAARKTFNSYPVKCSLLSREASSPQWVRSCTVRWLTPCITLPTWSSSREMYLLRGRNWIFKYDLEERQSSKGNYTVGYKTWKAPNMVRQKWKGKATAKITSKFPWKEAKLEWLKKHFLLTIQTNKATCFDLCYRYSRPLCLPLCNIWRSLSDAAERSSLLGCDAVLLGFKFPAVQRTVLPSSSRGSIHFKRLLTNPITKKVLLPTV